MGKFWVLMLPVLVVAAALLSQAQLLPHLWVFPLHAAGLGLWFLLAATDAGLATLKSPRIIRLRLLLWCGGLLWFTAAQGVPWLGLIAILVPAVLWVAHSRQAAHLTIAVFCGLVFLFAASHIQEVLHPGLVSRLGELRFSIHILTVFLFFRLISWTLAIPVRGGQSSFLETMEYFIAPAFWLSPLHATYLVWTKPEKSVGISLEPILWICRGLLHALLFGFTYQWIAPWLGTIFSEGLSAFFGWRFFAAGASIFLLAYLEKSRVSYLSAGFLRISGYPVEPDFRSPWLARSLVDFWRRFHYWVWQFYVDTLFFPMSAKLLRYMRPERALFLGVFLTFFLGTTISHYISYPASFVVALVLAFIFGLATIFHLLIEPFMRRWAIAGIALTWLTVFLLYILAYPAFGLGWSGSEFYEFFRR